MLQDFLANSAPPPKFYLQFQTFVPDLFNLKHIF